jgi:hypothetical protein
MKTTPPGHPVVDSTLRAILRIAELWGLSLMCFLTAHAQPWNRTNLTLWLKADAGITLDGKNGVSRWADQSSRSNHSVCLPVRRCTRYRLPIVRSLSVSTSP